ncbi:MAG: TAXI family TRAP transporter solute-binding subunit [Nitrospiraceae bacterium]|nr:MAG: TAXI family TRAP transporter solute-binding subunit [Nitrospiraceae bacterium]
MKKNILVIMFILSLVMVVSWSGRSDAANTRFYTIGTGGVTGVYYPTGGAISRIVNAKKNDYNMRLTVESTGGSVYNINAIMAGDLDFGIVQSDRQFQAIRGLAEWKDNGAQKDLRAVFSIHPESVTLLAGTDTGIKSIRDLKGKHVNIGNPGSGQRQNSIDALTSAGINYKVDLKAEGLKAAEAPGVLLDGRIDAFFYTVGHPSGAFKEATAGTRKVSFIPIVLPDSFYLNFPYYARSVVPMSFYPNAVNDKDIPTFGVKATFVTHSRIPDEDVYHVVKEIFENFEDFKKLHPAYSVLTKESMLTGLSAPLHPGATKYFNEAGLLK